MTLAASIVSTPAIIRHMSSYYIFLFEPKRPYHPHRRFLFLNLYIATGEDYTKNEQIMHIGSYYSSDTDAV